MLCGGQMTCLTKGRKNNEVLFNIYMHIYCVRDSLRRELGDQVVAHV